MREGELTWAQFLGSAYLLGADDKELHEIYDIEDKDLEAWTPSPSEVTEEDWRDFWGDKKYGTFLALPHYPAEGLMHEVVMDRGQLCGR